MELIITEKPSVGRAIAAVVSAKERKDGYMEGNGMLVSWCIGHLVELALPETYNPKYLRWRYKDLPILPEAWQYTVSEETKKQFDVLCTLMNSPEVDGIICATDAGREGELIFRLVYEKSGCKKHVRRLWISSMEESAILNGLDNMKPMEDYDNLYKAALCRAQADWLIGMNATRLYSLLYGPTLHVGRVMTPTLAMLVQRENEIRAFKSTPFYTVKLETPILTAKSERMDDWNTAKEIADNCNRDYFAIVQRIEQKQRTENPPLLYDLTALQRDANKLCGFTAQQTLDYAQSLYEKKLLTYPRTDSRYLTQDMQDGLSDLASRVGKMLPFASALELHMHPEKVINDSKVSDHHAIIPTAAMPEQEQTIRTLTSGERDLLYLVCTRFLCALDDSHEYDETTVTLVCGGHSFTAKGKQITDMGWQRLWYAFRGSLGSRLADEDAKQEASIPKDIAEGMEIPCPKATVEVGKTTPPAHHTEGSILRAMETAGVEELPEDAERKGIGTPATRAAILEKLIETRLLERVGDKRRKLLVPTQKGRALASVLPEKLLSPLLTAEWEQRLKQIEKGQERPEDFMNDIQTFVKELVRDAHRSENAEQLFPPLRQKIGVCPKCGAAVTERSKGFLCENGACDFAIWKNSGILANAERPLTSTEVRSLLERGQVRKTGLRSAKTHAKYDATLHLEFREDGRPILRPTFEKG